MPILTATEYAKRYGKSNYDYPELDRTVMLKFAELRAASHPHYADQPVYCSEDGLVAVELSPAGQIYNLFMGQAVGVPLSPCPVSDLVDRCIEISKIIPDFNAGGASIAPPVVDTSKHPWQSCPNTIYPMPAPGVCLSTGQNYLASLRKKDRYKVVNALKQYTDDPRYLVEWCRCLADEEREWAYEQMDIHWGSKTADNCDTWSEHIVENSKLSLMMGEALEYHHNAGSVEHLVLSEGGQVRAIATFMLRGDRVVFIGFYQDARAQLDNVGTFVLAAATQRWQASDTVNYIEATTVCSFEQKGFGVYKRPVCNTTFYHAGIAVVPHNPMETMYPPYYCDGAWTYANPTSEDQV